MRGHTIIDIRPLCQLRLMSRVHQRQVDAWRLAPHGLFAFAQRWAWRFLKRFAALEQYDLREETYQRVVIDHGTLMDRVLAAKSAMFDEHRQPKHILIGSQDFDELMDCPRMRNEFARFSAAAPFGREGRLEMLQLTWHILPWMRGFVVLPENF